MDNRCVLRGAAIESQGEHLRESVDVVDPNLGTLNMVKAARF